MGMAKYIVLSVNDNPDYLYFTPLTCWAWRKFGWEPVLMISETQQLKNGILPLISRALRDWFSGPDFNTHWDAYIGGKCNFIRFEDRIDGYRSDTITQVSRLYAACRLDGYIMTGDIDMIPLSDYWQPEEDKITVYGHDLTGYSHYPICYIGMPHTRWIEVMGLNSSDYNALIKRDLDTMPQAKNPDFYKYWFTDQDLITQRIQSTEFPVTSILRGQYKSGYAFGRVDRGQWTLDHPKFIDAHLFQQIHLRSNHWKFDKTMELLHKVWPDENFDWFVDYHNQYKKLTGND